MPEGVPIRLLLVEDSESDEALILTQLRRGGFDPRHLRIEKREEFLEALKGGPWDIVIADFNLPSFSGLEALELFKQHPLDIPFILVSGTVGEDIAVQAMKAGGNDYMLKDRLVRLVPAVRRELKEAEGRARRRKVEQELRESTELISQTFRACPDAMIVVDLEGQKIIESNECYDRIFGHAKGGISASDGALLSGWETPSDIDRILKLLQTQGFLREFEAKRRTAAGSIVVNLISAEKLELGSLQCAVMVFRDITEWKNATAATALLEAQLRQSQKLEAIGRLAGGIAHDFNNILAAIMGNAQLADTDLEEGHPAKENIRQTLTAAIRARELISQILVFSRRGDERREPTQLNTFVRDSMRLLRATVPTTIDVSMALPETIPDVLANPTQLLQVLLNLTANAVHAMEATGGRLELTVAEASSSEHPSGPYVVIQVRDTGTGMDADVIEHIFEPFFTTKEAGEGTGLGLAMVHGIVKQHGGHVEVQSAPGQGTSFRIYFPVWSGPAPAAVAPFAGMPKDLSIGLGKCVMVLDDEVGVGDTIEKVLRRFGYMVESFAEPMLALAAFRESAERYSLVITDLTMPQMKGTAFAEAIWQLRQGIPILLITGFNNVAEIESYRAMGLRGPLRKPFLAESLVAAVAECIPAGS